MVTCDVARNHEGKGDLRLCMIGIKQIHDLIPRVIDHSSPFGMGSLQFLINTKILSPEL